MPFKLNKLKNYRKPESFRPDDLIDIKLPAELAAERQKATQFLIFVVDDDPYLLQALNTQLSDIQLTENSNTLDIVVRNYATGRSALKDLHLRPDLFFINPEVNLGIKNALSGSETVERLVNYNQYLPILILGQFDSNDDNLLAEPFLRDQILSPMGAQNQLTEILNSLVENQESVQKPRE